jgi:O-antigen ligase
VDRSRHPIGAYGGVLLFTALACGWLFLSARTNGGAAAPPVTVLVGTLAAFTVASAVTRFNGWIVPLLCVAAAALFAALRFDVLLGRPLRAPLGYSNAAGALFMLASAAALLLIVRTRVLALRVGAALAGLGFAAVPLLNNTRTATVMMLLFPLALLPPSRRSVRVAVVYAAAMPAAILLIVLLLAATYRPGEPLGAVHRIVDATLSERRLELWHDALNIAARHPVTGAGPGRYPVVSAVSRKEYHTRWPHNEALHFAAEAGLPGMLIPIGMFAIGFAWLWWRAPDRGAAVAALALAGAAVHSNVDYILHSPAVPMLAAALVGAGAAIPRAGHAGRDALAPAEASSGPADGAPAVASGGER